MELTPDHKPALARKKGDGPDAPPHLPPPKAEESVQLNIMDGQASSIINRLKTLDINSLTPIGALNLVCELRDKALER
jgi:hypothetical protein